MVIKSYNFKFFDSNVLCRKLLQHVELVSSSTLGWRSTILSPVYAVLGLSPVIKAFL